MKSFYILQNQDSIFTTKPLVECVYFRLNLAVFEKKQKMFVSPIAYGI